MIWEVWNTDSCHAGPYTWILAECWIGSVCEAFVYPNKDTQRPDWQAEPKFLNSCSPRPTEQLSCCWLTGSRIWNTLFCLWGHTFQYSYCLPFYLHFLHLIRALSANTGTLSLTSNRIMFSNNLQSTAYTVIALTVQSLTSEVTTISFSHSLSSCYRSPNLHALHREIHLQNYQGGSSQERVFSNIWDLTIAQPLWDLISAAVTSALHYTRSIPLFFSLFACPKKTLSNADAHSNPVP